MINIQEHWTTAAETSKGNLQYTNAGTGKSEKFSWEHAGPTTCGRAFKSS